MYCSFHQHGRTRLTHRRLKRFLQMGDQVSDSGGRQLVLVASGDATFDHGGVDMVDLAMRYVADRRRRGELSKKTATDVRRMLFDFLRTTGATRQRCSTRQIEKWIYCRGAAAGTTRVRLSCVRKFFQWAVSNRHLKKDPTVGISRPKLPQSAPRKLTMPAATAVARSAPDARGRLIVLLMLQEGLRCRRGLEVGARGRRPVGRDRRDPREGRAG